MHPPIHARVFRKVLAAALAASLVWVGPARAQAPDAGDLNSTGQGAANAGASLPDSGLAPAEQALPAGFGPGAPVEIYDFLDAAAQPEGKGDLAYFYRAHVGPERSARGRLLRKKGATLRDLANETLSTFLGLPSWTASDACDAVVETLARLAKMESSGSEQGRALASRLETTLVGDVASEARSRGRPGLAAALAAGQRPAGGWTKEALEGAGVQVWDYALAATRLIDWVERRDVLLGSAEVAKLLVDPPDPAAAAPPTAEFVREVDAMKAIAGKPGPQAAAAAAAATELTGLMASVKGAADERTAAGAALAQLLGVRSINTRGDLSRLVRRYLRDHRSDPAAMAPLEQAMARYVDASRRVDTAVSGFRLAATRDGTQVSGGGTGTTPAPSTGSAAVTTGTTSGFDQIAGLIPKPILTEIYKQDISASLKLLDLTVAEGVTLAARYQWALNGRISDKYSTRVDTWDFNQGVNVGDWIQKLVSLPFGVSVAAHEQLVLARQFKDPVAAATALPRTPLNIPFTAEKARAMDMGDFYSIPADVSFATGIGTGYTLSGVSLGAGISYVVSGRFHLQVFKTDPDHIRVRIVAMRSQGPSVSAGASYGIQIFGIRLLDGLVRQLLGTSLGSLSAATSKGLDFSADYVFDLRDPAASAAYDKVMTANLKLSPVLAANALLKASHVAGAVLSDLRPAEDLFHADADLDPARRRVNRLFKGINRFSSSTKSLRVGIRYLRFDSASSWVDNDLVMYAPDESTKEYAFPVYNFHAGWTLLFGLFDKDRQTSLYALEPIASGATQRAVSELVLAQTLRDASAGRNAVNDYRDELRRCLGATLAERLDVSAVPIGSAKRYIQQITLAMDGDAVGAILDPARTPTDRIWDALTRLIPDFPIHGTPDTGAGGSDRGGEGGASSGLPWGYSSWSASKRRTYDACKEHWGGAFSYLETLVDTLEDARKQDVPLADRVHGLMKLGGDTMFRSIGTRWLIELTDPAHLEDQLYVAVHVDARDWRTYDASAGQDRFHDLYAMINDTLANLSDRDFLSR